MGDLGVVALSCLGAYIVGSINVSIIVLGVGGFGDPRRSRSGNPGATNVYRLAGPLWAGLVLALDLGRAAAVALAARMLLGPEWALWTAPALLAGNRWPLFHGLRGGKGVANLLGYALVASPVAASIGAVSWLALFAPTRVSCLGSLAMVTVICAGLAFLSPAFPATVAPALAAWALVVWAHRPNLRRLASHGIRAYNRPPNARV